MSTLSKRALQIQEMHRNGMTYDEIGKQLGVSRQAAYRVATYTPDGRRKQKGVDGVIYVGLRDWMFENRITIIELSRRIYMHNIREQLYGTRVMTKYTIDAILRLTGMSYEECFKEEEAK